MSDKTRQCFQQHNNYINPTSTSSPNTCICSISVMVNLHVIGYACLSFVCFERKHLQVALKYRWALLTFMKYA